jgi:hypothetical protein
VIRDAKEEEHEVDDDFERGKNCFNTLKYVMKEFNDNYLLAWIKRKRKLTSTMNFQHELNEQPDSEDKRNVELKLESSVDKNKKRNSDSAQLNDDKNNQKELATLSNSNDDIAGKNDISIGIVKSEEKKSVSKNTKLLFE